MAINAEQLNIILSAQTKDLRQELTKAEKRIKGFEAKSRRDLKNTTKSFDALGRAARTLGPILAAAFSVQTITSLTRSAAEIGKLAAGTATIGKLGANSGVDIGDVDVTSIANGSLNGPAAPTVDSYANIAINLTTGANQVLVAAPGASKQIWVYGVGFSCDTAATTVSFQDEDDTAISGVMSFAQYGGLNSAPAGNFAMPMWKVATNKALEVDITTGDVDGWLAYGIVSV